MEKMSIPKIIHYCWFGHAEKSDLIKKCMESWRKYCPDWEIIEWNEDNFDIDFCPYATSAYKQKRYGFLTDAARLDIICNHGGVYLDTDVELVNSLDDLLDNGAWFGYGTATEINTGSGFGAVQGHWFIKLLLDQYRSFSENTTFQVCTKLDSNVFLAHFPNFAADHDVRQQYDDILIIENIWHYCIHHYTNTWMTARQKWMSKNPLINSLRRLLKKW